MLLRSVLQWCNWLLQQFVCDHFNISPSRRGVDKSAPGRQRLSTEGCRCVSCIASPLTDQIVRMRGEICQGNIIHSGDSSDAAVETATLHLGKPELLKVWACRRNWDLDMAARGRERWRQSLKKCKQIYWPAHGMLRLSPCGPCKSIIEQNKDNSCYTHRTLWAWWGKLIWGQNKLLLVVQSRSWPVSLLKNGWRVVSVSHTH